MTAPHTPSPQLQLNNTPTTHTHTRAVALMRAHLASRWPEPAQRVIYIFLWKRCSWAKPWGWVGGVASPLKINLRPYIISACVRASLIDARGVCLRYWNLTFKSDSLLLAASSQSHPPVHIVHLTMFWPKQHSEELIPISLKQRSTQS